MSSRVAKWDSVLRNLRPSAAIIGRSTNALSVRAPRKALRAAVDALVADEYVHSVSLARPRTRHNAGAQWVLQSGSQELGTSIWDRGVDGEGQTVVVSDSGLDMNNCLFADDGENPWGDLKACTDCTTSTFWYPDPQLSEYDYAYDYDNVITPYDSQYVPYCEWSSPECTSLTDDRKVVAYLAFVNSTHRDDDGHGSHCAGSAVGAASPSADGAEGMNVYQGMAPAAKLIVVDNSGPSGSIVDPPANLTWMFDWGMSLGARIHSASWGMDALFHLDGYDATMAAMDEHVFDNPESLIVIAASNEGLNGYGSVGPEASAKNVLTVGALETSGAQ
eukprot:gene26667-32752_t